MSWKNMVLQLWPKMLSTNQISAFSDHQYFWKESIEGLDSLDGDNHQRNVTSETNTFG